MSPAVIGEEPVIRILPAGDAGPGSGDAIGVPEVEVRPGELVLLEGAPGSGKSTILRAAVGLGRAPALRVEVDGRDMGSLSHGGRRRTLARLRLLYLPREPALLSNLTVLENLLLPIRFLGERPAAEATGEAEEHLRAMGLGWAGRHRPARLSRSDRKAVALLRGLLRRPRAALLDDPLAGLARQRADALRPLLRAATREDGCAMLMVSRPGGPYRSLATRTESLQGAGSRDGQETML